MVTSQYQYDVLVIGAGHAGCEAALAAAEEVLARAEQEVIQAAANQKTAAEQKRDTARAAVEAARKTLESPGETYTPRVEALKTLDGKPIIAADTDDNRYFKRLRIMGTDAIVLESLDSGGDYGPVVLAQPGNGANCLERVWPVAGVLFELPS